MAMLGNGTDSERLPYLLDRIKQLETALDAAIEREVAATDRANVAEAESRWRKVSEEMPDTGDLVLVANARYSDPAAIGYLSLSGWNWESGDPMLVDPTHWRPLPAPPKED